MQIAAIMARYVEFLPPSATIQDAATLMGELDFGALPIGTEPYIEGILTDRDILYRATAAGLPATTPVAQIMTQAVISCLDSDTVAHVLDVMAAHHVRRMPVRRAGDAAVIGWVTLSDVSRHLLLHDRTIHTALETLARADVA